MIKQKKSIEKWAKEIVRCELILQDTHTLLKKKLNKPLGNKKQ